LPRISKGQNGKGLLRVAADPYPVMHIIRVGENRFYKHIGPFLGLLKTELPHYGFAAAARIHNEVLPQHILFYRDRVSVVRKNGITQIELE
jgi:hypothetical protein